MPTIALIQDGTQVARSKDADVRSFFEDCCDGLSTDGTELSLAAFTDEGVDGLLETLDPERIGCLVLASNALLSDAVQGAIEHNRSELQRYLVHGGGLIILHQHDRPLDNVLPPDLLPQIGLRRFGENAHVVAQNAGDILLNYPEAIAVDGLCDGGHRDGPKLLYWWSMIRASLPNGLQPVLSNGDEVVLARTAAGGPYRVVLSTIWLDWQRNVALTKNVIRYGALGSPRRVLWRIQPTAHEEVLLRWLTADGVTAVREMPSEPLSSTDQWLLSNVDVCVVPAIDIDRAEKVDEVRAFLKRGGSIVAATTERDVTRVTAFIGSHTHRVLSRRLYAELHAVPGWRTHEYAFELRNIVSALTFLHARELDRTALAILPGELADLAPAIRERLADVNHHEDLASSIALATTLCQLDDGADRDPDLVSWMLERVPGGEFDVALQVRAVGSLWRGDPDRDFAGEVLTWLRRDADVSLAAMIRVLTAAAVLDGAGLFVCGPEAAEELGRLVADRLDRSPPRDGAGWISTEGTADVTLGIACLVTYLPDPESSASRRLAVHLADGATALREAMSRYERNPIGVAWLARVVHALLWAEERYPVGLQHLASLPWPGSGSGTMSEVTEESLITSLTVQNKELRAERDQLDHDLGARSEELRDQMFPARFGRGVATLGAAALVAAAAVFSLVALSPGSVQNWLVNVAAALALGGSILGLIYAGLKRLRLLSPWGESLLTALGKGADLVSGTTKFKQREP